MKREEIIGIEGSLKNIKNITDKQEYLVSTAVNQEYQNIMKCLDKELERLDTAGVELNCPQYIYEYFEQGVVGEANEALNKKLIELVKEDNKIVDYGININDSEHMLGVSYYIKYTS